MVKRGLLQPNWSWFCFPVWLMASSISTVSAADFNVSASVPTVVPSVAAVINQPAINSVVAQKNINVAGICQLMAQPLIVSIWRDNSILGSAICANGLFSIDVNLILGENILVAKSQNTVGQFGPNSSLHPVSYRPSIVNTDPTGTNLLSNFQVNSGQSAAHLSNSAQGSIEIIIQDGKAPYQVIINWGDGNFDELTLNQSGNHVFDHQFAELIDDKIVILVTDADGNFQRLVLGINSSKLPNSSSKARLILNQAKTWWNHPLSLGSIGLIGTFSLWPMLMRVTSWAQQYLIFKPKKFW